MEWIHHDTTKELEMIKHKRYYQFSSDLETAKMFYQEEMKKNSNNTFIRDDCIYRLSLIASMICREEDYCDYCCYSKLSSIIPSSSIDLSRIQKSNQSCKIYKNNLILIMPYFYYDESIYNIYNDKYIGYSTKEERDKIKDKKVLINDIKYLYKKDSPYLDYINMISAGKILGEYESK